MGINEHKDLLPRCRASVGFGLKRLGELAQLVLVVGVYGSPRQVFDLRGRFGRLRNMSDRERIGIVFTPKNVVVRDCLVVTSS